MRDGICELMRWTTRAVAVVAIGILVFLAAIVGQEWWYEYRADVTALVVAQDGNLHEQYSFSRVCIFPTSRYWVDPSYESYSPSYSIVPDSNNYWSIVLIDDDRQRYTHLIVDNRIANLRGGKQCAANFNFIVTPGSGSLEITPKPQTLVQ